MADFGELTQAESSAEESRPISWARPSRAFAIVALVFGFALVLVVPPFQSPDELNHFFRAYQISEGTFISRQKDQFGLDGGRLPASIGRIIPLYSKMFRHPNVKASVPDIRTSLHVPLNPEFRVFYTFANTAHYCPTCYLAQCIGITLGRIFNLPPLVLLYLGRITNLLVWILLGYLALRLAPAIARPTLLLLLMPMSLALAASVSADPSTTALATLFTAMICRYVAKGGRSINRGAMVLLAVVSIPLSVSKLAYVPMLALPLLARARNFGGSAKCAAKVILLAAINLTSLFLWVSASSANLDTGVKITRDASPRLQLQWLQHHPGDIPDLFYNTIRIRGWNCLQSYVGIIGLFDRPLPGPLMIGYLIILILACWWPHPEAPLPSPMRAAAIVFPVVIATTLIIALLEYLYWSPPGLFFIDGLSGRFFIPLTPAIFVVLCSALSRPRGNRRIRCSQSQLDLAAALVSVGVCCYYLAAVWGRYYG